MTLQPHKTLYDPPRVGGDILSFCGKCKMELAHVVVSMMSTRPSKVMCKTCRSHHAYKKGGVSPRNVAPRASRTRNLVLASELWEKKMAELKNASVMNYTVADLFSVGQVISHAQFGMGVIEEDRGDGKVIVLFRGGDKVLVHGLRKGK